MAAVAGSDLLALQGNIKRDAEGYKDEFLLQYRHFLALLDIFKLKPSKESKEFADLVNFIAQVLKCYPKETQGFVAHIMELLDIHYAVLDGQLRRSLVQALILLRNRGQLEPLAVLPLFFRLFRCQDKVLRQMLFKHIISDIKNSNKKHRNEKLNRALQNFMYSVIADDNEAAAKKSLAVCTELWRRHVWRDARTINVIASAASHKSSRIMLAVMKFFLGQDHADEDGSDADSDADNDDDGGGKKMSTPSREELYKAMHQGTRSSRKKKKAKIQRALASVKKAQRKGKEHTNESFAALHLLHDPQTFAEKLFARLQSTNERFETRLAMISVISRVVSVHKLMLLNFYPYLQKYIAPHQRDVTVLLAALVGACHDLVPPENLAPVLRQLVDQFVHDRARPEVMTIGLRTVREMCLRTPLVMTEELLQDLALYKKFRDKEVSNAARGLIGLFRELNPNMLVKKDRGRAADLEARPKAYGEVEVRSRVDGAELLEAAEAAGLGSEDDDFRMDSNSDSDVDASDADDVSDLEMDEDEDEEGAQADGTKQRSKGGKGGGKGGSGDDRDDSGSGMEDAGSSGESEDDEGGEDEDDGSELVSLDGSDDDGGEWEDVSGSGSEGDASDDADDEDGGCSHGKASSSGKAACKQQEAQPDSLASLKRQLAEVKAKKAAQASAAAFPSQTETEGASSSRATSVGPSVPIEMDRILTEEDFARIRRLKQKQLIEAALAKHGLKSASKARAKRLLRAAEEEAEEALALQQQKARLADQKVNPDDLLGNHKRRRDKEERLASVLAGREGRDKFGAATSRKKQKTGGLSEKEKQKRKAMPISARIAQLRRRSDTNRRNKGNRKAFKGHVRK